ncbi:unnamed protein product [Knipowitschia caucasica]|uniref:CASP8 and FADD-like apoptosis regulator n=1 Tax=Knipowitschia caucasica TaxID=637954 RepID=A0AAV2K1I4_KNICA
MSATALLPLLCELVDSLSELERRALVFLCGSLDSDHSPARARSLLEATVTGGGGGGGGEGQVQVLRELLVQLRRIDLLRSLCHCGKEEVERHGPPRLSPYRVLMFKLSEELTSEDLNQLKFLLGRVVPRDRLDRAKSFLDVITELEKQAEVSSDRLELVQTCLRDIGRLDLSKRVHTFTSTDPEHSPGHSAALVQRCPPVNPGVSLRAHPLQLLHNSAAYRGPSHTVIQPAYRGPSHTVGQPAYRGPSHTVRQPVYNGPSYTSHIEHYRLNTESRGVCLILDCVGLDGDLLEQTFLSLHFSVIHHRCLTVSGCMSVLTALQQGPVLQDASALVCCFISRGNQRHLLATDAQRMGLHLDSLRRMFSHCTALTAKPKLFFIQSYSVEETHTTGRSYTNSEELETDGIPFVGDNLVPTDADVFWSHCWTPESQLQTPTHYSHYLRALMGALQPTNTRSHLLDLHLRVNAAVCEHNQRNPELPYHLELKHTLTKHLYLH